MPYDNIKSHKKSGVYPFCRKYNFGKNKGGEEGLSRVKRQPHKIVKHTQTNRGLLSTNCLSVFDHFTGLVLEWSRKFVPGILF